MRKAMKIVGSIACSIALVFVCLGLVHKHQKRILLAISNVSYPDVLVEGKRPTWRLDPAEQLRLKNAASVYEFRDILFTINVNRAQKSFIGVHDCNSRILFLKYREPQTPEMLSEISSLENAAKSNEFDMELCMDSAAALGQWKPGMSVDHAYAILDFMKGKRSAMPPDPIFPI